MGPWIPPVILGLRYRASPSCQAKKESTMGLGEEVGGGKRGLKQYQQMGVAGSAAHDQGKG